MSKRKRKRVSCILTRERLPGPGVPCAHCGRRLRVRGYRLPCFGGPARYTCRGCAVIRCLAAGRSNAWIAARIAELPQ